MRKTTLVLLLSLVFLTPAIAEDKHWLGLEDEQVRVGIDAPNLVMFSPDWTLGAEVNKDVQFTNVEQGWVFLGKVTYSGSIFDFSKGFGQSR